jgi:hypothetical protein
MLQKYEFASDVTSEEFQKQLSLFERFFDLSSEECFQILYNHPYAFFVNDFTMHDFKNFLENILLLEDKAERNQFLIDYCFLLTRDAKYLHEHFFHLREYGFTAPQIRKLIEKYPFFLFGKISNI